MDIVELNWRGAYPYKIAREVSAGENVGIYLITGKRGSMLETILIIGHAYDQYLYQRLADHKMVAEVYPGQCYVRFGTFVSRISRQRLNDVEKLLIFAYQPRLNTIGKDLYKGRDLQIINRGRFGPIDSIVRPVIYNPMND
jgi:hypothetical protein